MKIDDKTTLDAVLNIVKEDRSSNIDYSKRVTDFLDSAEQIRYSKENGRVVGAYMLFLLPGQKMLISTTRGTVNILPDEAGKRRIVRYLSPASREYLNDYCKKRYEKYMAGKEASL